MLATGSPEGPVRFWNLSTGQELFNLSGHSARVSAVAFSADGKYLLATASDSTHELFQGIYVCLHSDPQVGGLNPGEARNIHGKIYFLKNDVPALLKRYEADFPVRPRSQ